MSGSKLFLDDIRNPPDDSWTVVRSFEEFIEHIQNHPMPDIISFDHDLGDAVPTGMDCAKWLTENNFPIKQFKVHSANPPGAANIKSLLECWQRFNAGHGRQ